MLDGHDATIQTYKAHPDRSCGCRAHKAVCSCGWEKACGVDGHRRARDAITDHRLDCIERVVQSVAPLNQPGPAGPADETSRKGRQS